VTLSLEELRDIYSKAIKINEFERNLLRLESGGQINIPIYLGLGQEFIAATIANYYRLEHPAIFAQHRAHSYYLAFGGDQNALLSEILGDEVNGCAKGFGGSVGIYSKKINMFGHTGLMGEQVYLGVGWSFATKTRCLVVIGDATIEEDYVLPSIGFAAQHNLPITFVCEDNGLAVLTPTSKRRIWNAVDIVNALGVYAVEIADNPEEIVNALSSVPENTPIFLNIKTQRLNRHVGGKLEGESTHARMEMFEEFIESNYGKKELQKLKSIMRKGF
jgi:TPP-dependent pyruvate/acetoin dehydrogenase alpha subunit